MKTLPVCGPAARPAMRAALPGIPRAPLSGEGYVIPALFPARVRTGIRSMAVRFLTSIKKIVNSDARKRVPHVNHP